ncbi:MAG: hypothetical protein ACJ75B_00720 [Flavisolibacter sp.]
MKTTTIVLFVAILVFSCGHKEDKSNSAASNPLIGTWKLLTGTLIEKGDTTITHYTGNLSFIKIINDSHFAFLQHDLKKGKDSAAVFVAGGGRYSLRDSMYTEHLEYCSDRQWEGNDFDFIITIHGDTLVQRGVEKVQEAGVNRINMEKYIRLKNQNGNQP